MFRWIGPIITLLCILGSAVAQVNIGQMTQIGMSGTIGASYGGGYSDFPGSSSHNVSVDGDAQLTGYYFHPNFLNFTLHPYYGRSQDSTDSVSIGTASGIGSSAQIFGGSAFPGWVTFSKTYNSTGQYAMPGASSLVTNGNSSGYGFGWAENLPGLPHLSASFSHSASDSSIIGIDGTTTSNFNGINVASTYTLAGWQTNASYNYQNNASWTPETITGIGSEDHGGGSYWQLNGSHALNFLPGSISLGYTHSNFNYNATTTDGTSERGDNTANSANAYLNLNLTRTLTSSAQFNYNDNLLSSTVLQMLSSGTVPLAENPGPLRSLAYSGSLSWSAPHGFMLTGGAMRAQQFYDGISYDTTQAYGNVNYNYSHPLLGSLYLTAGMSDSATQNGNTGMGFYGTATFDRVIRGYNVSATASYSQNMQTLAAFITTSGASYGVGVSKKLWHGMRWHGNFGGGHSVLSSNGQSHQERLSTGISRRRLSLSTFWGQAHQYYMQTTTGLVDTGVTTSLLGGSLATFDMTNYGISASFEPMRRMSLVGSFSKEHGTSTQQDLFLTNSSTVGYLFLRYRLRKLYFTASYNRVLQGVTSLGTPLHPTTSYTFGLYRGIKFF